MAFCCCYSAVAALRPKNWPQWITRHALTANGDFHTSRTGAGPGIGGRTVCQRRMESIYSLLVFKNGHLVAEDYFNGGSPTQQVNILCHQRASTLGAGRAGSGRRLFDQSRSKMMDFFPGFDNRMRSTKRDITIRQMLPNAAGYPWEEGHGRGNRPALLGFPYGRSHQCTLARDPGSGGPITI